MTATPHAQRSPEWHRARAGRITASIVGGILSEAPYMTRDDVMRLLVRQREGAETEFQGNVATQHGTYHEEAARADFMMETGLKTRDATFVTYEDWAGATTDAYTSDDGLLETKCPYGLFKKAEVAFKPISEQPHYFSQCQFQMLCTGKRFVHFYQYIPARMIDGVMHDSVGLDEIVHWDQGWHDTNMPILRQFYAQMLDEPAEAHLAPKRPIVDTPAAHMMVAEWDDIMEAIGNLESRKKELLEEMVAMAGERNVEFAGRKLTKTVRSGQISYAKAIKELLPNADLSKWKGKDSEFWGIK